ncbi:MAG: rRNA pseudouridine synthase [Clostridia bacterium]|nr:rRNA pseudouridine synthase [Clostridia bacterium]
MEPIKLQKYFTDCGVLSRRAAEEEIRLGRVRVNGEVATLGMRIDPDRDRVEYKGKLLRPSEAERICLLLNKPRGYLTTLHDDRGRRTVAELIASADRRVYPVGRLDMDSDGLLLFTDDGDLANRLTHPRHEIPKIYRVWVKGTVSKEVLEALRAPMDLDGYRILPVETEPISYDRESNETVLSMRLYEGRNRQIRKMCEICHLTVTRLSRIAIGEIQLGNLPVGTYRKLTDKELAYLRGEITSLS